MNGFPGNNEVRITACDGCHEAYWGRPHHDQHVNDFWTGALRACELEGDTLVVVLGVPQECEVCT